MTLLERDAEVAALEAAIERGLTGDGARAVVSAHAGLGKTRLLDEACHMAARRGMRVLRGAGNELEREFSFGVALQLFEPALPPHGTERDALFEGAAGLVRPLLEEGRVGASGEGAEFPLLHGLYWLAANLAERAPVLLAVDDLHWADASSLRFLAYLSARLDGVALVLVLALRPREPGAFEDLLGALTAQSGKAMLRPPPLGAAAVGQLIRERFPAAAPEFTQACHDLTDGNPLLLEALLRGVEERAQDPTADTGARLAELAPEEVLRSALARVTRLPTGAPELARATAVLGPSAYLRTAAELGSLAPDAARSAADALAEAEILRAGDPLRFVHPLLRAVIYDDLPVAERAAAHRRAARLLADDGAPPDVVASHLLPAERAGDDWTVRRLEVAAAGALRDGSPGPAVIYLRRALEEPPSAPLRAPVLHALGRAEAAAGAETAVEHLGRAFELAGSPRARAEVTLDYARVLHSLGRGADASAALDRALAELDTGDESLARELEATWVSVARLAPTLREQAVQRLEAIVEHPHGDTPAERQLLAQASGQLIFAGEPRAQACALAERALAGGSLLVEGGADDQGWLIALASFIWSDEFDAAVPSMEACVDDARRRGLVRRFAYAVYGLHLPHHYGGELAEAVADLQEAIEARHHGWREYLPAACGQLAWTLIERDQLAEAERALTMPDLDDIDALGQVLVLEARARLKAVRGDAPGALGDALESGRIASGGYVMNPSCLPWRSTAALAAAQLGELDQARELVEDELSRAHRFGAPRPIGVALRASALVEGGDEGIERLREAVTVLANSPATLEHTRALVDLGGALRRAGHRADARHPLRQALATAERLGLTALERRAHDELAATGAKPRRRHQTGIDSLTPSERRVAQMAATGMTNREIAQALFVTTKAVQFHLGNTYRKLDITSRDQLGEAFAARQKSGRGAQ